MTVEDEMGVASPPIHVLLGQILAELPAVGKASTNEEDGYSFRGIDDALNALNPILSKYGVFYLPTVLERRDEQRSAGRASVHYVAHLKVRFRFYGPNGDYADAVVWGEGQDTGDKGTSKAHTAAQKVALVQAFCISTKEAADQDPDRHSPEATHGAPPSPDSPPADEPPFWQKLGWSSKEELDDNVKPVIEQARHLTQDQQAALKEWRTEQKIDLPPSKEQFPAFKAKVAELAAPSSRPTSTPEPPVGDAPAGTVTTAAQAPASASPTPTNVDAQPVAPATNVAQPEAAPAPAAPDPVRKAEDDLAVITGTRERSAAATPEPVKPDNDAPEDPQTPPKRGRGRPPKPKDESAPAATTEPPAEPQEATAGQQPSLEQKPDDDSMECQAKYEGCAGLIEHVQQKDMSRFRWGMAMCRSCNKNHAAAAKAPRPANSTPAHAETEPGTS